MSKFTGFSEKSLFKKSEIIWAKYGQWCYRFKFPKGIRLHWLSDTGFLERLDFKSEVMYFNKNRYFMCQILMSELDPPIHLRQFEANCGKIWYIRDPETNRPSFCLILKLSHAVDGLSVFPCLMYYLGCMVVSINVLFAEWRIAEPGYF